LHRGLAKLVWQLESTICQLSPDHEALLLRPYLDQQEALSFIGTLVLEVS
jgi:hypothetical protein